MAVIKVIQEQNLVENSHQRGEELQSGLRKMMDKHQILGDVRGLGLMVGFEFVQDQATKDPFPAQLKLASLFEKAALNNGLITYPCTGSIDGVAGDMILLAPPLIITPAQVAEMLQKIDLSISELEELLPS
jgi:4-aminobutyrate aminotransferase-like enzyme